MKKLMALLVVASMVFISVGCGGGGSTPTSKPGSGKDSPKADSPKGDSPKADSPKADSPKAP